jgi:hypothetical protein
VHVVGYTEAHHAATADEVIASCKLAHRAIENALNGAPDMTSDPNIQARIKELVEEAQFTLEAIRRLAEPGVLDPLTDPPTLTRAVTSGILDAPHLRNNPYALGKVATRIVDGKRLVVDHKGNPQMEWERLASLGDAAVFNASRGS